MPLWASVLVGLASLSAAAADPPPEPTPAPTTASVLPGVVDYTRPGILLPVQLNDGRGRRIAVRMRLDTGATLTTLSLQALEDLGLTVPPHAPSIVVSTANGPRRSHLLLVDRIWVGGHEIGPVTIAVCDECAELDSVGLLGLNVTDRFATFIDPAAQRVVFTPLTGHVGELTDVGAWVGLTASVRTTPGGRGELEVGAVSDAPREIAAIRVRLSCGVERELVVGPVPAGQRHKQIEKVDRGLQCDELELTVLDARWGS